MIINTSSQLAFHGAAERAVMPLLKQVFPNLQNQLRQNGRLKELEWRVLLWRTLTALDKNVLDTILSEILPCKVSRLAFC